MGAFLIYDISFKTRKDRERFEAKYKLKKKDILVDQNANCFGFAWTYLRNPTIDIIYNMGFLGYAEPDEMLKECRREGINITFWAWLPINDRKAAWEKIRGRW